jgi:general secretion pathway protein G
MKVTLNTQGRKKPHGFTLIEMIGVLAIIAILAAVLIPKVFQAINSARVNNAAMACNTVKTAVVNHYAKFGSLLWDGSLTTGNTLAAPYYYFDQVLSREQFLDKPFDTKIGDSHITGITDKSGVPPSSLGTRVDVLSLEGDTVGGGTIAASDGTAVETTGDELFDLSGSGANTITGSYVVVAVITGVPVNDALALSMILDGGTLSVPDATKDDLLGRVKYAAPTTGITTTTFYIYLTHR